MALSSAFHERLEQMEHTRNQRFSLLQAEKSLQETKYQELASKLSNIRSMEQRCLALDQKIASQNFKISVLNSEIESLDAKHLEDSQKLRDLKSELEELEELGKEKERFYELKGLEMKDFGEKVERFVAECRTRVNELRNHVDETLQRQLTNDYKRMETLADCFLANLHELSDNEADFNEENIADLENMEEDGDKEVLEALNYVDLDCVSKLHKTLRFIDIMHNVEEVLKVDSDILIREQY